MRDKIVEYLAYLVMIFLLSLALYGLATGKGPALFK